MSKNTSNKFLWTFSKILIGTSVAASLGVGAFYIYKAVKDDEFKEVYKPKIFKEFDNIQLQVTENYNSTPYLGDEGLEKLKTRINNDLGFGPEIQGLKNINIVDSHYIGSENNGVFFDATKQIFINANNMKKMVPQNGNIDDKVEVVFQVVFHEYGHFVASSYLKNNNPGTTDIANIYYENNPNHKMTWSKHFTNEFKKLLKYDVDSTKYPYAKGGYIFKYTNGIAHVKDTEVKLLANKYNPKELFDLANSGVKPKYIPNINEYSFGGRLNAIKLYTAKKNQLPYLYNLDELYTRKYQQINMVIKQDSMFKDGWIVNSKGERIAYTPFIRDVLHYQPDATYGSINNEILGKNWRFFNDAPYGFERESISKPDGSTELKWKSTQGVSNKMNKLMLDEFGQSNGADISYITSRNTSEILNESKYSPSGDGKQIKLGGYLSSSENYNFIGVKKTNNGIEKFVWYPISRNTFKYGYKPDGLLGKTKTNVSGENKFYTTDEWIYANDIKDEALYFADDINGTNATPLTSVRDSKVGKTSNYFLDSPSVVRNYYEATSLSGKVIIKEGTWN